MKDILRTISFFGNLNFKYRSYKIKESYLSLGDYKIKVLFQSDLQRRISRPTVILMGGFSVYGYRDPRMINLFHAINSASFNPILISPDEIENLQISTKTISSVVGSIQEILSNNYICNGDKVALLAPSYSAGIMLAAAADPSLENNISSICTIGTYASLESSLSFIMNEKCVDDYARLILFKNIIPYTELNEFADFKELINAAIYDNGLRRDPQMVPVLLKSKSLFIRDLWKKLQTNKKWRFSLLEQAYENSCVVRKWAKSYNISEMITKIKAPVVLLHGTHDSVIPASESEKLYQLRKQKNLATELCVTPILSHGDISVNQLSFQEIKLITHSFSRFFNYADKVNLK